MADNTTLDAGSGGDTIASDDISGVKYPRSKIVIGADGTNDGDVSATNPLPIKGTGTAGTANAGVVTVQGVASMTPIQVGDNSGSLTVDNAGTFAVQESGSALTALQLIDDIVYTDDTSTHSTGTSKGALFMAAATPTDGSVDANDIGAVAMTTDRKLHVSVQDALPAGTNAIGKLAANSGVDIGDVDVTSVPADPFGANADAASATGSISAKLRFIASTGIPVTGTVTVGSHAVTNAGTFAVQESGAALTSLQLIDDTVFAEDAGHTTGDKGIPGLAVRNDSDTSLCDTTLDYTPLQVDANGYLKVNIKAGAGSGGTASTDDAAFTAASGSGTPIMGFVTADSVDSGDVGVVGMLANRQLKVTLYDSGGVELAVGGGTQYTEDAAAAANPVGNALNLVRDDARGGSLTTTDGDNVAARGTNAGELYVKHVDTIAVTQSGSWNIGTVTTVTGVTTVSTVTSVTDVATISSSITPGTGAAHLGKAEDAAHSSGDTGVMLLAVRKDTAASLASNNNDYIPLTTNATGYLWVDASGQTLTVASHAVTNAGTFAVQESGAALTALQLIDNPVLVDDAAFTPATSSVMMAGFEADESSTDSVDEGDAGAARMTLDRKVIVNPQPHTAGGLSIFRSLDLDETEEDVKTSAGQVYGWWIYNASTSVRYVKFYNATAANVTVGSTTPVLTLPIPAASSGGVAANLLSTHGIAFDTAICVAATTALADADTGAPSANDVVVNIWYK